MTRRSSGPEQNLTCVWSQGFALADLRRIGVIIRQHEEILTESWHQFFGPSPGGLSISGVGPTPGGKPRASLAMTIDPCSITPRASPACLSTNPV